MKFNEIPGEHLEFKMLLKRSSIVKLREGPILQIAQSFTNPGDYELISPDGLLVARAADERKISELDSRLSADPSYLARIEDFDAEGGFTLKVALFSGSMLEFGDLEIGVDEYVSKRMGSITGHHRPLPVDDRFCSKLNYEFCFKQGPEFYFFALVGASIERELNFGSPKDDQGDVRKNRNDDDEASNSLPAEHQELTLSKESSFCVVSQGISFVAAEKHVTKTKSIYVATRLHERKQGVDRAIRLVHGNLVFRDWTSAGQVQIYAKYQLAGLMEENSSYLKTWDDFGNIEGEILLRDAREFGVVRFANSLDNRDGSASVLIVSAGQTATDRLEQKSVEALELIETLPEYLKDLDMSFEDFSRDISNRPWKQPQVFKVLSYESAGKRLTLDVEHLPESGSFILSLQGETTQIRRRNSARRAIMEGRSANPQLGLLLEENGVVNTLRQPKKIRPLNASVRSKVFKNDPTYMQEKAIEIALNTPDIALIQGPPGTGKTTVIAAIVERLNQESTKQGSEAKGQVLLTGFQHDAVENMIDRISLNSIPVPKIGRRSGQAEDELTAFEKNLDEWCERIIEGVRAKYPELAKADDYQEFQMLAGQYVMAPTQALAATLMGKVARTSTSIINADLVSKASRLEKRLLAQNAAVSNMNAELIRAARQIRTSEVAYLDDGPERADDALDILYDFLDPRERKLLRHAASWKKSKGDFLLRDLRQLKESLLMRLTTPPVFRVEKGNQEVLDILEAYLREVEKATKSNKDRRLAALSEFISDLESGASSIIDAISEYSFAFAATCQQSAGQKMQALKGIGGSESAAGMEYEYVIVDEAARVSPRDLMIPMAQGKRIILVGDHRQLPHIIDEEVARQMEEDGADTNEIDWLKKSMFEYLFTDRLKSLERQDGIARTVTLDKQFRMHPLIGDFISRNFYERFNPAERVTSGLPASMFAHNLPHTDNKPVAWLEVPAALGLHTRRGTSWVRQAEIDAIAHQLFEWMSSPEGRKLTFGVISFYKAQANQIASVLKTMGADEERLKVGTVDSFQGMEFDVVFLSMVRTLPSWAEKKVWSAAALERKRPNPEPAPAAPRIQRETSRQVFAEEVLRSEKPKRGFARIKERMDSFMRRISDKERENQENIPATGAVTESGASPISSLEDPAREIVIQEPNPEDRKQAQRLFGHLCLYNRLNVSMSRQKRLLVVAGDSELLKSPLAEQFIPGLVDFYRLCREEGVILHAASKTS